MYIYEAHRGNINYNISFSHNGKKLDFKSNSMRDLFCDIVDWLDKNGYDFSNISIDKNGVDELISKTTYKNGHFHNINNKGEYIQIHINNPKLPLYLLNRIKSFLSDIGIDDVKSSGFELYSQMKIRPFGNFENDLDSESIEEESKVFVVRAGKGNSDANLFIDGEFVGIGYGLTFNANEKSKQQISDFLTKQGPNRRQVFQYVHQIELFKSISVGDIVLVPDTTGKVHVGEVSSEINFTKGERYPNRLEIEWLKTVNANPSVNQPKTVFTIPNFDTEELEFTDSSPIKKEDGGLGEEILPPSHFIKSETKSKPYKKNPFGCKDEEGNETSALCIIGKSGTGKTTTTEDALESMGHECLLYIPIEGEYTFSQFTGEGFEMSSFGEFLMMAQNDPGKCYTVIFDECHRPITISKLNTDLLQALSSRRNRGGDRFVTMDRTTKRKYTTPSEEFPIPLKEKSGKVFVPDNFGIVCLSSNPAVICRNEDFLNRVDLVIFNKSDRRIKDLTELVKLRPDQKNIENIRGLLSSDE